MAKRRHDAPQVTHFADDATIARIAALERENDHLRQIIRDVHSMRSIDGGTKAAHLLRVAIEDAIREKKEDNTIT